MCLFKFFSVFCPTVIRIGVLFFLHDFNQTNVGLFSCKLFPYDKFTNLVQFFSPALNAFSITATIDGIEQLTGNNFSSWKAKVTVVLGVLDLDYALRVNAPTSPAIGVENYDELKKIMMHFLRSGSGPTARLL